jgi:protein-S-isoprenylcysteine O-methyltransferase Ste14
MTAVPGFDPGLWNAWWFFAYYLALALLVPLNRGMVRKMGAGEVYGRGEQTLNSVVTVTLAAAAGYSVGCPLLRGTWWFYLGVPLAVGGLGLLTAAVVVAARTPPGRPFTTGPYRCSRHPMVVFGLLGLLGAGVAAGSWLLLLLVAIPLAAYLMVLDAEERRCLATFGEAYSTYQARTPKYLGIPG